MEQIEIEDEDDLDNIMRWPITAEEFIKYVDQKPNRKPKIINEIEDLDQIMLSPIFASEFRMMINSQAKG